MKIATADGPANPDGGGLAVTVRCEHRSENRWAVQGSDRRRIGTVCPVEGSPADWWAVDLDGDVQGRAATFGAALGMVVDAAIDDVTGRGGPAPDVPHWAVHGSFPPGFAWSGSARTELRIAALKRENAALRHANRELSTAVEEAAPPREARGPCFERRCGATLGPGRHDRRRRRHGRHGAAGPPIAEPVGGLRPDDAAHRGGAVGGCDRRVVGRAPRRRHPG